jgi:hypothetical protein
MKPIFVSMDYDHDWALIRHRLGLKWVEDTRGIVAIDLETKKRVAAAIFNNWTWSSVQVHLWIENPLVLRHGFFQEIYQFAFVTGGRDSLIGMVPEHIDEAVKLNKHIGFKEIGRIPGGYRDDEAFIIMQGTREDLAHWQPKIQKEEAA